MDVIKPLLWLLEPYIIYKAYLWGARFMAQPFTWEGDVDLFAFTLAVLLWIDVFALPLFILCWPGLNPDESTPHWIQRLKAPFGRFHAWIDEQEPSAPVRKTIHGLLLFLYYLVPIYIGMQLVLALVISLLYDVLVWAQG